MMRVGLALAACLCFSTIAGAQMPSPDLLREMAPQGRLRAAINYGNPVLAHRDAGSGALSGVSVDLASELGRRIGREVELIPFETAGKVFEAAKAGAWDIAFLAIDPVRAGEIGFTAPYVLIEGTYLVPSGSALRRIEDVDAPGIRIAVGGGSAYDLFLTRALKHATIVRAPTSPAAVDLFLRDRLEAVAGVKQPLAKIAAVRSDLRLIEGRFMEIRQAMGVPVGRPAALAFVRDFLEEMKAGGFVAEALARHGQNDATVAPAGTGP